MTTMRSAFLATAALVMSVTLLPVTGSAAPPGPRPVFVPADVEWLDTGIPVTAGDTLDFVARGRAKTGPLRDFPDAISDPDGQITNCVFGIPGSNPDCALDGAPYGALVGRVGSDVFFIGAMATVEVTDSGNLELAVNDNLGTYFDNKAGFIVFIR